MYSRMSEVRSDSNMGKPGSLVYCGTFVVLSGEGSLLPTSLGSTPLLCDSNGSYQPVQVISWATVMGLSLHILPNLSQLEQLCSSFELQVRQPKTLRLLRWQNGSCLSGSHTHLFPCHNRGNEGDVQKSQDERRRECGVLGISNFRAWSLVTWVSKVSS